MVPILLAIDGSHMRRIPVQIGTSDSELISVVIDPFPENMAVAKSFRTRCSPDAHDICRKTVPVASPKTAAMIGAVVRGLEATGYRLTVIVPKSAGYAGRKSCTLRRVKHLKQFQPEIPVDAANHIIRQGHAGVIRGPGVLPGKILVNNGR
jgi:hypothetical protein